MDYCCENCGFLFRRMGDIQTCPSCEGFRLRAATKREIEQLERVLKHKGRAE